MVAVQSEFGRFIGGPNGLFIDFTSEEVPVAGTVQSPIILGGGFKLIGEGNNADDGLVLQNALNGVGRLTTTDEDTEGMAVATEPAFDPANNGTLVMEARVSLPAQTARSVFVGFNDDVGDVVTEQVTGATATITYVTSDCVGFLFDSQLTSKNWHMVYKGGTTTAITASGSLDSGILPVNGEFDILRVEIDPNGTARWYINGKLEQTVAGAASTTVNLGVLCGVWATTTTVATLDVDYVACRANRHWDRDNA